jgi:hypothetical protein
MLGVQMHCERDERESMAIGFHIFTKGIKLCRRKNRTLNAQESNNGKGREGKEGSLIHNKLSVHVGIGWRIYLTGWLRIKLGGWWKYL